MSSETVSREQAIRNAAQALIDAVAERASKTVEQAARDAWYPGHPLGSVEAIADAIRARREQDSATYPSAA